MLAPLAMQADPIDVTYQFAGVCSDCIGTGIGSLTLVNYTPGTSLSSTNFVSFTYSSSVLSFSIPAAPTDPVILAGMLPGSLPGPATVELLDAGTVMFSSLGNSAGAWCAGADCASDEGSTSTWVTTSETSAVPEPATVIPVAAAIFCIGLVRRRSLFAGR